MSFFCFFGYVSIFGYISVVSELQNRIITLDKVHGSMENNDLKQTSS